MSWSITRTGALIEVADAIQKAITDSASYVPTSPRRVRTAGVLASAHRKALIQAATDEDASPQRDIVASSSGHISDDGSVTYNSLTFSFATAVAKEAEPTKTAPGPDAVTHEEVNTSISGAAVPAIIGDAALGAPSKQAVEIDTDVVEGVVRVESDSPLSVSGVEKSDEPATTA